MFFKDGPVDLLTVLSTTSIFIYQFRGLREACSAIQTYQKCHCSRNKPLHNWNLLAENTFAKAYFFGDPKKYVRLFRFR